MSLSKNKRKVTTRTPEEMEAYVRKVKEERKKCSSFKEACDNLGDGYSIHMFNHYQRKKKREGKLTDKRRSKGIPVEQFQFIIALISLWPNISFDSYLAYLNMIYPGEFNRTKLENFLIHCKLSTKEERKKWVKDYYGENLPTNDEILTFKLFFSDYDQRSKIDKKNKDKRRLAKEQELYSAETILKKALGKKTISMEMKKWSKYIFH